MKKNILKNTATYCDKLILCLLLATVVVVPLFFDIRLYSVFDLSKVMSLYLLTIIMLGVWTVRLACDRFRFSSTPIDVPLLAYVFIFMLSTALSINPIISLFGTYKRFEGLTATLCYIFVFYAIVTFVTTRKRIYALVVSLVAGVVISSFYGIAQHFGYDLFQWSSFESRRVFSTFGNPVFFSAYLITTLPVAVALYFWDSNLQEKPLLPKKSHSTWIFFAFSSIIYTTFWLTNTRACFIALLGGLTPLLYVIYKKRTTEKYKFVILLITFTFIGIFFNLKYESSIVKRFVERFTESDSFRTPFYDKGVPGEMIPVGTLPAHKRPWIATKLPVTESTFSRIFQYLTAIEIVKDYPLLGIGPDTIGILYQRNLAKVFSVEESDIGFQFPRQDRIHNDILDTATTRGVIGLGTYVWLLAVFGFYVGRNYKRLNSRDKYLILGLSSGIVSYLIQNEFSFGNTPIVMLFWAMMGICIAIVKVSRHEESQEVVAQEIQVEGKPSGNPKGRKDKKPVSSKGALTGHFQSPNPPVRRPLVIYKWLGCGIAAAALVFVFTFALRTYQADAYFEYGRRIVEYERQYQPEITEKGFYFLKQAILLNPYETTYRDELCRQYLQMAVKTKNEVWAQKAYGEVNNSLRLIPQHFLGYFHLGMVYQLLAENFGRPTWDAAVDCYKKAIAVDPFQSPFHSNLASLYLRQGNVDQAIGELYQAYLIRPEELNHAERLANIFLQKGDMDKSLYFFQQVAKRNPNEPGYYNNIGAILNKKGMQNEAIDAFKKAIHLNPKEPIYQDNLARLCLSMGKNEEAVLWYKKLIDLNPSVVDYHNNLGYTYKRMGQFENAVHAFQKAVAMKPDNPVFTHNLASTYVDFGRQADAKNLLQTFTKTCPGHNYLGIHLLLANLFVQDAEWENAVAECTKAIKIDEKSSNAYKMLGIAYYNMRQYEPAGKTLNQALALAPDDQEIKDMVAKVSAIK